MSHPLPTNTWLRSEHPVMDEGDHGERNAPAGALGRIVSIDQRADAAPIYQVVFHPSGIVNFFETREIDSDFDVLPKDSPEIPPLEELHLVDAVLDVYYSGQVDEDTQTVSIDLSLADRLALAAKAASPEVEAAIAEMLAPDGAAIPLAKADALAALVGVGDRFQAEAPAPSL